MEFSSRQLRAFQLVAQHRNFTRAAEALFITTSGLSVLIRELEAELGFRLFDRTTRKVVLTACGTELLAATQSHLHALDVAFSRIGQIAKGGDESLAIGTTPLIAANIIPDAISQFRHQRPGVSIRLLDASLDVVLQRIESGKLDIGLGSFKKMPGIRRTPLFRYSLVVIRAGRNRNVSSVPTPWSALSGEKLISMPPHYPHQQLVDEYLTKAGVRWQRDVVVNLMDTQIALVEADEGIAVIPSFGLPAGRNRRVVMSQLISPVANLEFHQISNSGRELSLCANEFSTFLKEHVSRWALSSGVL